ncbi:MAG: BON domain-containing protein [Desulfovibrionaceae bacterium]|jgi:osmotically-inducible protein OsmY|nr:BON domain-containing protein [Desulfovibrionaceae bacterium]
MNLKRNRLAALGVVLAVGCGALGGCGVFVVGGAATASGVAVIDRRSAQTQWDDQIIELRASSSVSEALHNEGHISIVSYNRKVLLSGEAPTEEARQSAQTAVAGVPNVAGVVNELAVMPDSPIGQRSKDTYLTSKVKTGLLRANGVPGNSIKVVTDRGTVYLLGRLTQRETDLATEVARTVSGVERVVRVIDIISEQEALHPDDPAGASAPATPAPVSDPAASSGAVTQPVNQPTFVQQPPPQPIEVQTLPPVK